MMNYYEKTKWKIPAKEVVYGDAAPRVMQEDTTYYTFRTILNAERMRELEKFYDMIVVPLIIENEVMLGITDQFGV